MEEKNACLVSVGPKKFYEEPYPLIDVSVFHNHWDFLSDVKCLASFSRTSTEQKIFRTFW